MNQTTSKTARPVAPEELDGAALLEWNRLCDELDSVGKLATADRGIIALAAQTYAVHQIATRHVNQFGPILPAANHVVGRSPFYSVQREQAILLATLLDKLGLTPTSRGANVGNEDLGEVDV